MRSLKAGVERRNTPRINEPLRTIVAGVDRSGERFRFTTLLDNISRGGLYLYLPPAICPEAELPITEGMKLFFVVELFDNQHGSQMAMRGRVVRTELKPSGACGVGVRFSNYRHL
jgi:c-di-GMP-binding flagellar brake protein YcgR